MQNFHNSRLIYNHYFNINFEAKGYQSIQNKDLNYSKKRAFFKNIQSYRILINWIIQTSTVEFEINAGILSNSANSTQKKAV